MQGNFLNKEKGKKKTKAARRGKNQMLTLFFTTQALNGEQR